ncbi:unnamed protein product [Peniophora sp. CBMAI 1063]|nr:unnamed protein product [Peniophora sp. CBMAI 1063]
MAREERLYFCKCASTCSARGGQWINKSTAVTHRQDDEILPILQRRRQPAPPPAPETPPPTPGPASSSASFSAPAPFGETSTGSESSSTIPPDFSAYGFGPPVFDDALAELFRTEIAELLDEPQFKPLVFVHDPASYTLSASTAVSPAIEADKQFRLSSSGNNSKHLRMQARFYEMLDTIDTWPDSEDLEGLSDQIYAALGELDARRVSAWVAQHNRDVAPNVVQTDQYYRQSLPKNSFVASAYVGVLALSAMGKLDRSSGRFLLATYRDAAASTAETSQLVDQIPKDPRTVLRAIDISPRCRRYAACPRCSELYPTDEGVATPRLCTKQSTPKSPICGEPILHEGGKHGRLQPILPYKHQDILQWLARLLSRPDIEDYLESAHHSERKTDPMSRDWDGERLYKIKDEDGEPFLPGPPGETHIVFSWSFDSFNPYFNMISGVTASSTGFWLVCMSLPESIRYREENIYFVSCYPGKPDASQINPILSLIVRDFLMLWRGVWFSRTRKHRAGRFLKAIVVPQISDSDALRQGSGHSAHNSAHFCLFCALLYQDIENLDPESWPAYDVQEFHAAVDAWKNAQTDGERASLWKQHGQRWTPFFDLPYYDFFLDNIFDPMHTFKIRIIEDHIRRALAYRPPGAKESSYAAPTVDRPPDEDLLKLYRELLAARTEAEIMQLKEKLDRKLKSYSWAMCKDLELRTVSTIYHFTRNIEDWRRSTTEEVVATTLTELITELEPDTTSAVSMSSPAALPSLLTTSLCWQDDTVASARATPIQSPSPSPVPTPANSRASSRASSRAGLTEAEREALREEYVASLQDLIDSHHLDPLYERFFYRQSPNTINTNSTERDIDAICYEAGIPWEGVHKAVKIRSIEDEITRRYGIAPRQKGQRAKAIGSSRKKKASVDARESLTPDIVEEVWGDQGRTRLPTFVTHLPSDWGTAGRGKLSAAQWTVLLCVHLVITLVRLWGGLDLTDRRRQLLDHTMKLVDIILLVFRKTISLADVDSYEMLMREYLIDKKRLYKDVTIKPSDHVAMHYGDVLRNFGPTRSHDGSFYERFIRRLHSFKINLKPGEQESTYMDSAVRHANLRAMLLDEDDALQRFSHFLDEHRLQERWDPRGTKLGSLLFASRTKETWEGALYLPDDITTSLLTESHHQLATDFIRHAGFPTASNPLPRIVHTLPKFSAGGVAYCTEDCSSRDSVIAYTTSAGRRSAGVIKSIILLDRPSDPHPPSHLLSQPSLLLVIRPYKPLSGLEQDIDERFRRYPNAGFCCRPESVAEQVLGATQLISHVATTPTSLPFEGKQTDVVHCLPLGAVSSALMTGLVQNPMDHDEDS